MKNTKETKKTKTTNVSVEMVFILDKSGSMAGLESDTIGGFNSMISKQKDEEGEAYVTTVLFDTVLKTLHDRIPLEKVPEMTGKDYVPGGCTALLDAIGETVGHIRDIHKYIRAEDVPQKTLVVITTDGYENASRRFDREQIRKLIEEQKEKGWEFLFLGANIDAVATAGSFGISEDRAATYTCDAKGTELNFKALGGVMKCMRRNEEVPAAWKEEIEEDHANRKS